MLTNSSKFTREQLQKLKDVQYTDNRWQHLIPPYVANISEDCHQR